MKYYLALEGATGDVSASGYQKWFEVSDFAFAGNTPTQGGVGTPVAATGVPQFSDIALSLASDTALTAFIDNVTSSKGGVHKHATLVGTNDDGSSKLFSLKLNDFLVSSLVDSQGDGFTVNLDAAKFEIETTGIGAPGPDTPNFSWDTKTGTQGGGAAGATIPAAGLPPPGILPTSYFMAVHGMNGGSTDANHKGWFELSAFDFNVIRDIFNNEGGKAAFDNVHVNLGNDVALTRFLTHLSGGKALGNVRIEGVVGQDLNQKAVYDLTLSNVFVTEFGEDSGGGFNLSLDYRYGELKTQDPSGKNSAQIKAWDTHTGAPTKAVIAAPVIGASTGTSTPSLTADKYFFSIGQVGGDSLNLKFKNTLEISDFTFDISRSETSPGVYGPLQLANISVDFLRDTSIADLLLGVAKGNQFAGATIQGVDSQNRHVFTLNLADVLLTGLVDHSGAGFKLDLDYGQISVLTKGDNGFGTLVNNTQFQWDTIENNALKGAPGDSPNEGGISIAPSQYVMMVDGLLGGAQTEGYKGWFNVSDFQLGVSNSSFVTNGGGGAGKASFGELSVVVADDTALANLLKLESQGTLLNGLRIMGLNDVGGLKQTYQMQLADVFVSGIVDIVGGGYRVEFDYGQIQVLGKKADDKTWGPTFNWNVEENATGFSGKSIALGKGLTTAVAGGAVDFYISFDGVSGDATRAGRSGWFGLADFSFDVDSALSGINPRTLGAPVYSGMSLDLLSEAGLATFLANAASGAAFKGATIHGLDFQGRTVYDLDLGSVTLANATSSDELGMSLAIDFETLALSRFKFDAVSGLAAGVDRFGWNTKTNTAFTVDAKANFLPGKGTALGGASEHYLVIDGLKGDTIDPDHKGGWFDMASYDVSASKGDFGQLNIHFATDRFLTQFLVNQASGDLFNGLVIEGFSAQNRVVYDIAFGSAVIENIKDGPGQGFDISFRFGILDAKVYDFKGILIKESGWDLVGNGAFTGDVDVSLSGTAGDDTLHGTAFANTMFGGNGADFIYGRDGNDLIAGGAGNDLLDGGGGIDTVSYAGATGEMNVDLSITTNFQNVGGGEGFDRLIGFENLTGSDFADTLTGNSANNVIDGGFDFDSMFGLGGNDTYIVDSFFDSVFENAAEGTVDTVLTTVSFDMEFAGEVENLIAVYGDSIGINLQGSNTGNTIKGADGDDFLGGLGGNDTLDGGVGADEMNGGADNDTYLVDNLNDFVIEVGGGGDDTVIASTSFALGGGSEIEHLIASATGGDIILSGNEGLNEIIGRGSNDLLNALGGEDTLFGLGGNDRLIGGEGHDFLTGGAGQDKFALRKFLNDLDIIEDFNSVDDQIEISASHFGIANAPLSGLQFVSNTTGEAANGGNGTTRFIYDTTAGQLFFDADGTGGGLRVEIAEFTGNPTLTISDFTIIA